MEEWKPLNAGAEDMNRLDPFQYDIVRRCLRRQPGADPDVAAGAVGSSTNVASSAASSSAAAIAASYAMFGPSAGAAIAEFISAASGSSAAGAGSYLAGARSTVAAAAAAMQEDVEPYAFDVFLTLITGTERSSDMDGTQGRACTPLLATSSNAIWILVS